MWCRGDIILSVSWTQGQYDDSLLDSGSSTHPSLLAKAPCKLSVASTGDLANKIHLFLGRSLELVLLHMQNPKAGP